MLRGIPHVNQNPIWILPGQVDDLFQASKNIFARVVIADRRHRLHQFHDRVGVLGQIDADNSFVSIVVISITNESDANLLKQSKVSLIDYHQELLSSRRSKTFKLVLADITW